MAMALCVLEKRDQSFTHKVVETVFEDVLAVQVSLWVVIQLGPQIADRVTSTELERDQVVDFVLVCRVMGDAVFNIDAAFLQLGNVPHTGCITGPADRRSSDMKGHAWRSAKDRSEARRASNEIERGREGCRLRQHQTDGGDRCCCDKSDAPSSHGFSQRCASSNSKLLIGSGNECNLASRNSRHTAGVGESQKASALTSRYVAREGAEPPDRGRYTR